jgi:phage gpG-like protein
VAIRKHGIEFRVTHNPNVRGVKTKLQRRLNKISDLKPANKKASIFLDQWVQRNFKSSGGNVGGWRPFRAGGRWVGTGRGRRFDPSAKLLMDTGNLRASFHPFFSATDAGIGSDLEYALYHEEGKGVPQRRMLPRHDEVDEHLFHIYDKHVELHTKHPI